MHILIMGFCWIRTERVFIVSDVISDQCSPKKRNQTEPHTVQIV